MSDSEIILSWSNDGRYRVRAGRVAKKFPAAFGVVEVELSHDGGATWEVIPFRKSLRIWYSVIVLGATWPPEDLIKATCLEGNLVLEFHSFEDTQKWTRVFEHGTRLGYVEAGIVQAALARGSGSIDLK